MSSKFSIKADDLAQALKTAKITITKEKDDDNHKYLYLSTVPNPDYATPQPTGEKISDTFLANAADATFTDDIENNDDTANDLTTTENLLSILSYAPDIPIAGVTYAPVLTGEAPTPWLITPASIDTIQSFLKPIAKDDEDNEVTVKITNNDMTITSPIEAQQLRIAAIHDTDGFEAPEVKEIMSGVTAQDIVQGGMGDEAEPLPVGKRVELSPTMLKLLAQVGSATNSPVALFTIKHPASVILCEAYGWRGFVQGQEYSRSASVNTPDTPLLIS